MDKAQLTLPALLVIMDGFGMDRAWEGNAISLANKPNLDDLWATCSSTKLEASGEAVWLPDGQMGNSEVGHLNIGAGRVVYQELTRINKACREGTVKQNAVINQAIDTAKKPGAALHFMGLMSDGGVHSSNEHLFALIDHAVESGVSQVFVHCFMDGRDVPPSSGVNYIDELEQLIDERGWCGIVSIATISGRYYAMDRDKRWERVQRAYNALVSAEPHVDCSSHDVMLKSYENGVTDEFVEPVALYERGVKDGDAIVFFNFRPDRARQISHALVDAEFDGFERQAHPQVFFVCLTEYEAGFQAPVAFPKEFPENVLADVLAGLGLKQYHIAETEKYAHVTFFLNGGVEAPKEGEERKLIASPKVATYDLQPEMSEPEVADALEQAILNDVADVYIVNFANCDMVGHTGVIPAAVKAVEAVDEGVGKVVGAIRQKGGFALVTADHGNADKMIADDGSPHTAHTTALVPFILMDASGKDMKLQDKQGALCDIAPTILDAMGLEKPAEMTGESLLA